MEIGLLSTEGLLFLFRWMHFFFGIIWIGLLYYFNFVQGAFFAETDAATKSNATQKLVPRALWWFRYAALFTFLTGIGMLAIYAHQNGMGFFFTKLGALIMVGSTLATIMFLNVWLVIWPNQKIVIASATQAATGGQALPNAAAAGAAALLASRTNVMFSIPMLFYMGAGRHLPLNLTDPAKITTFWAIAAVIIAALELNALKGKLGVLTKINGVITCGFVLTLVFYVLMLVTL